MTLELCGDANDYVGKGLSGGKIIIAPPASSGFRTDDSIIVSTAITCSTVPIPLAPIPRHVSQLSRLRLTTRTFFLTFIFIYLQNNNLHRSEV